MIQIQRKLFGVLVTVMVVAGVNLPALSETPAPSREQLAFDVGTEAYLYGVPIVQMYKWREHFLRHTSTNQFFHFRDNVGTNAPAVAAPNPDVLYSVAWLDLTKEPVILSLPEVRDRYVSFQAQNFYGDNSFYVGTRTSPKLRGDYAYVGPGWQGKLPEGVQRLDIASRWVVLVGRTYVANAADLPKARAVQDSYRLAPLSLWKSGQQPAPVPPVAHTAETAGMDESHLTDSLEFFVFLDKCIRVGTPKFDYVVPLKRFALIGIGEGKPFTEAGLDRETRAGLERAIPAGKKEIAEERKKIKVVNGWVTPPLVTTDDRTDLLKRAVIAATRVGVNSTRECYYVVGQADGEGKPLAGPGRYSIRFAGDQLPPSDAFWSITVYRAQGRTLTENPQQRYSVKSLDASLKREADGSIVIYLQPETPGIDLEANWLPIPEGEFVVMLRIYEPRIPKLVAWQPPTIARQSP
jgi:hypothetical protein